jgi:hypothetical protein
MRPLKFTFEEANAAYETWGFNCGPAAVAAICGLSINELRPHLGDFETKHYTNPTLMRTILLNLVGRGVFFTWHDGNREQLSWPSYGLARVQWEGPWTEPGVPMAARYRHTHWVGVNGHNHSDIGIWDVNCLNNGTGWVSFRDWHTIIVPHIVKCCHPRASGKWHLSHSVEIKTLRLQSYAL